MRATYNVPFATRGGFVLHGDLHRPLGAAGTPGVLVVVHGGGWLDCANRRASQTFYADAVTRALDVATFNVDYRLGQEGGGFPENVMDIKCAVQWVRAHASEYGLDGSRVGVMGGSAGAHLAMMVALTQERDDLDPQCADASANVDIALSYSGPTDLPRFVASQSIARDAPLYYTAEDCTAPLAGCVSQRPCLRCVDASPRSHACSPHGPLYLLQAPDPFDRFVEEAQARLLAADISAAGSGAVTLVIPTEAEMVAAGCTAENGSHANDLCLIRATQAVVNPALVQVLGPRQP